MKFFLRQLLAAIAFPNNWTTFLSLHRVLLALLVSAMVAPMATQAQGPPITSDKPIMLGANRTVVKTLTEVRKTEEGTFTNIPIMVHYLPTADILIGLHAPLVNYRFDDEGSGKGTSFGDLQFLLKYQFVRKDEVGKTFRMAAKGLQHFATGKQLGIQGISESATSTYVGLVAGLESIRYGISGELGYNFDYQGNTSELRQKVGFGLPLLKPVYPVNQLNLYFEYQGSLFTKLLDYQLLYAQGIQYARGANTIEAAIQLPVVQSDNPAARREFGLLFGMRRVF